LDNITIESALLTLKKFPQIFVVDKSEYTIMMDIMNAKFCLWLFSSCDYNAEMPIITAVELNGNFPHLMMKDIELLSKNHRAICLYENDFIVKSLFSFKEKIEFVIGQLLNLLNLSDSQKEHEYQKEFLYYWNSLSEQHRKVELFIQKTDHCCWLNVYYDNSNKTRIVHPSIYLNDLDKMTLNKKCQALYIPITNSRGVLPPTKGNPWTINNVLDILDNKQFAKISFETYQELLKYSFSKKSFFLVFEMSSVNNATVSFCCEIAFRNPGTSKLLSKIKTNVQQVKIINTSRCDYEFLNNQIGNDLNLLGKKVAIIGIGSLGSYIAYECVRSGIKDLILIDNDVLSPENLMRHRGAFLFRNLYKTLTAKFDLECFHPQINVTEINKAITEENILDLLPLDIDLVIFAVGSTDIQLTCNRRLKQSNYNKPVLFCWLEGNGSASHILGVDYSKKGCYQCLCTDPIGNLINNKINVISEIELESRIIRNGCGGTRLAYGNSILLQSAYMSLLAIKKVFSDSFNCNFLFDFNGNCIIDGDDSFYEGSCSCCNEN